MNQVYVEKRGAGKASGKLLASGTKCLHILRGGIPGQSGTGLRLSYVDEAGREVVLVIHDPDTLKNLAREAELLRRERCPIIRPATYADVGKRVRLNIDLTEYHVSLKQGAEGKMVSADACFNARWLGGRACGVRFDEAGGWDILYKGLEVIE